MIMIRSGLVSATFKSQNASYVIKTAHLAGLKAIEWSENHHVPVGDPAFAGQLACMTRDEGLKCVGYGSYFRLGQGMDIRPSLDNAAAMEIGQMRIWAGSKASAEVSEKERELLTDELAKACVVASGYGIVLNLEWHKNTLTDTNRSGLELIKAIDSPYLRTLWQPAQALSFGERAEGLSMIAPYLSYLHVYYWDSSGRRPLSEGVEHWRQYFSLLAPGKDYYALLEFVMGDSQEQLFADAETLKEIIRHG